MLIKARIRLLLSSMNYRLAGIINNRGGTIVYYTDSDSELWHYATYTPSLVGLGTLSPLESNLSREDAMFKRDILLGNVLTPDELI